MSDLGVVPSVTLLFGQERLLRVGDGTKQGQGSGYKLWGVRAGLSALPQVSAFFFSLVLTSHFCLILSLPIMVFSLTISHSCFFFNYIFAYPLHFVLQKDTLDLQAKCLVELLRFFLSDDGFSS